MRALGVDPGLANLGWAQMEVDEDGKVFIRDCGVIKTEPAAKKLKVHASHDILDRGDTVSRELWRKVGSADIICHEGISIPRNSSATLKLGVAFGIIRALATIHKVPILQASTLEVKHVFTKRAGKEPRIAYVQSTYPGVLEGLTKDELEHAVDAIGCVLALQYDPMFRVLHQRVRNAG